MTSLTLIVAAARNNGIGRNGGLPWRLPEELKYFGRVTTQAPEGHHNAIVMGRNTWESIPPQRRPLRNRINIVISRNKDYQVSSLEKAPTYLRSDLISAFDGIGESTVDGKALHRRFIIGGASLYRDSLAIPPPSRPTDPFVDRILITRIFTPAFDDCDVFMPDFLSEAGDKQGRWTQASHDSLQAWVGFDVPAGIQRENGIEYEFQMWTRQGLSELSNEQVSSNTSS